MNYYNKLNNYTKYIITIIILIIISVLFYIYYNKPLIENFGLGNPVSHDDVPSILQQIQYGTLNYKHDETLVHSDKRSLTNGVGIYMFNSPINITKNHELRIYPMKYNGNMCFRFDVILKDNDGNYYVQKHDNRTQSKYWFDDKTYQSSALDRGHGWHTHKNQNNFGVYSGIKFDKKETVYGVIIAPRGEASTYNQYIKTFVVGYTDDSTHEKRDVDLILLDNLPRTKIDNIQLVRGKKYVQSNHPVPDYNLTFKIVESQSVI